MFGFEYISAMREKCCQSAAFTRELSGHQSPEQHFANLNAPAKTAGTLQIWQGTGASMIDRMIHFRLESAPVDTQLFFLFGRSGTPMPHFHAQVVQFSPEDCVFNADFLPRLDPVDHPDYYPAVFAPVTKAYWKAISDSNNVCALAPANPSIAAYLSPWSIGCGKPTKRAELERVAPQIDAFLEHYLQLADSFAYQGPPAEQLRVRDQRHLEQFFADELDPRAWKGVYGVIGEPAGQAVKQAFKTELRAHE